MVKLDSDYVKNLFLEFRIATAIMKLTEVKYRDKNAIIWDENLEKYIPNSYSSYANLLFVEKNIFESLYNKLRNTCEYKFETVYKKVNHMKTWSLKQLNDVFTKSIEFDWFENVDIYKYCDEYGYRKF